MRNPAWKGKHGHFRSARGTAASHEGKTARRRDEARAAGVRARPSGKDAILARTEASVSEDVEPKY
eukprot:10794188-Alexandrium_andersonii.AAC.1